MGLKANIKNLFGKYNINVSEKNLNDLSMKIRKPEKNNGGTNLVKDAVKGVTDIVKNDITTKPTVTVKTNGNVKVKSIKIKKNEKVLDRTKRGSMSDKVRFGEEIQKEMGVKGISENYFKFIKKVKELKPETTRGDSIDLFHKFLNEDISEVKGDDEKIITYKTLKSKLVDDEETIKNILSIPIVEEVINQLESKIEGGLVTKNRNVSIENNEKKKENKMLSQDFWSVPENGDVFKEAVVQGNAPLVTPQTFMNTNTNEEINSVLNPEVGLVKNSFMEDGKESYLNSLDNSKNVDYGHEWDFGFMCEDLEEKKIEEVPETKQTSKVELTSEANQIDLVPATQVDNVLAYLDDYYDMY